MAQVPNVKLTSGILASMMKSAQEKEDLIIKNDPEEDQPVAGEPKTGEEDLSVTHEDGSADKGSETDKAPAKSETQKKDEPKGGDTPKDQVTDFLSKNLKNMLDQQIGNELFAFYEYKAVASWCQRIGLLGLACWANGQAADEITHMEKVLCYLNELDLSPVFPELDNPSTEYKSAEAAVEGVLAREKAVTANWRAIGAEAMKERDAATLDLAQFFVTEQIEEEDSAKTILDQMKLGNVLIVDMMLRKA